jgi:uncharacterized protein YjbI with pentapeptide repeats
MDTLNDLVSPAAPNPPALADKADDLEAIRDSVVDAAGVSAGLWLSYLFVVFYLLVAAGGVTHRDLFFANPVKLPFLNIDLPLRGFFWLGPALFLVVHAYVLLHFVLLASKVGVLDAQLRVQIIDSEVRARLRRQLPINIFVQLLAGPHEVRAGPMGFLLRLIAWISLVIGPVALLTFFQLQFLPYHDEWVTWWQRLAVVIDLALLWVLWPGILRPAAARGQAVGSDRLRLAWTGAVVMLCVSLVSVPLVFAVATYPGEWLEKRLAPLRWIPLRETLVAGGVDAAARKPTSVWSNRLVLPGLDVIDRTKVDSEEKIAALAETASMRARHLEGAVLIGATLRKIDFTAAHLEGADLVDADLRGAKFQCAKVESVDFLENQEHCTQLQGALLDRADLRGARLEGARLQGAELTAAQLQGARLDYADLQGVQIVGGGVNLQGAVLVGANLHHMSLSNAQLQGARLGGVDLHGALIDGAQLQGADLGYAQLQGALLSEAQLQGAVLVGAQLQGAVLDLSDTADAGDGQFENLGPAQFQGAVLDYAQIQGTMLGGSQLQGASLRHVFAWRADIRKANAQLTRIDALETGPKARCGVNYCGWGDKLGELKPLIEGEDRTWTGAKLGLILDPTRPLDGEQEMARRWADLQAASPARDVYEKELAKLWREIGCAAAGAPYVLTNLIETAQSNRISPFAPGSAQIPQLAADFLTESCAGARGISESTRAQLIALRDQAPQQPVDPGAPAVAP